MNLSLKNKFPVYKYLQIWDSNYKFDSFINIFSILVSSISIASIIIIISVNIGFKDNLLLSISTIFSKTKIYNSTNIKLNNNDFNEVADRIPEYDTLSRIIEKQCVIRFNSNSEAALLTLVDLNEYRYKELSQYINEGVLTDSTIVLGKVLFNKLGISIGDEVIIVSFSDDKTNKVLKKKVSGYFTTNFLNIDSNLVYGSIEDLANYTYFLTNIPYNQIDSVIYNKYKVYNNDTMYDNLIYWIDTYDNPLKILIFFIFLISSINIIHNNYYMLFNKQKQIYMLRCMGLKYKSLRKILITRSLIIALISFVLGICISYLLLFIEKTFNFINIPEYVYFSKNLPINLNFKILYMRSL